MWDVLNATTMLSLPSYFVTPVTSPDAPDRDRPSVLGRRAGNPLTPGAAVLLPLAPADCATWYFGGVLTVDRWSFRLATGAAGLRVGLVTTTGRLQLAAVRRTVHGRARAGAPSRQAARPGRGRRGGDPGGNVRPPLGPGPGGHHGRSGDGGLDGPMQSGRGRSHWTFAGTLGSFGVFHNTRARGWAWLESPTGAGRAGQHGVSASTPGLGGGQPIIVHATAPAALRPERIVDLRLARHRAVPGPARAGTGRAPARPR